MFCHLTRLNSNYRQVFSVMRRSLQGQSFDFSHETVSVGWVFQGHVRGSRYITYAMGILIPVAFKGLSRSNP